MTYEKFGPYYWTRGLNKLQVTSFPWYDYIKRYLSRSINIQTVKEEVGIKTKKTLEPVLHLYPSPTHIDKLSDF